MSTFARFARTTLSLARTNLPLAFGVALSLGSAGLGGCFEATDGDAGMSAADYDVVAAALGALVADETRGQPNAFAGAAMLARGVVPADFKVAGDVAFGEQLGLEYSLAAICSDALGRSALCGDERGEAVLAHVEAAWSGDWRSERVAASSDFDATWTLAGLDQDRLVLEGRAVGSAVIALDPESDLDVSGWRLDYRAAYDDIGIDAKIRRAMSGQVFYDMQVERVAGSVATVEGRLCFQTDGSATLTLDGNQVYQVGRDGSVALVTRGSVAPATRASAN